MAVNSGWLESDCINSRIKAMNAATGSQVLGWATCLGQVREGVAAYLLAQGARLNLGSAIALDREVDVRELVARDSSLLRAHISRNEHHSTPLRHAVAKNRPQIVQLLLNLGAAANATDANGTTALSATSREHADPTIVTMLQAAGAKLDFMSALYLATKQPRAC
jgi:ankyrin repeat protein